MQPKSDKKWWWALALLLCLVVGAVIFFLTKKEVASTARPEIKEIRKLQIKLVYDTATITANALVHNPLPVGLSIDSLSYTILHQADTLGKGFLQVPQKLTANANTELDLQLGVDYGLLEKKIMALQKLDSTQLQLSIEAFLKLPVIGVTKIPFTKNIPVAVPKLPVIEVKTTKVKKFDIGDGVELAVTMQVKNNNLQDLTISKIKYTLQIEDFADASETINQSYILKAQSTSYPEIPMHLSLKEAAKAGIKKQFGDKTWHYNLKGTASVSSTDPMLQHLQLQFARKDVLDVSQAAGTKTEPEKDKKGLLKKVKDKIL